MIDLNTLLSQAREALNHGKAAAVFEVLNSIELAPLPPQAQVLLLMTLGRARHNLGCFEDSIACFRKALSLFLSMHDLTPEILTPELFDLAQKLSIGARDTDSLRNLIALKIPEFFNVPREFKISPLVNIRDWCRDSGIEFKILDPAREVCIAASDTNPLPWRYEVDDAWLTSIPNAEIIPGWDFVFAPTGQVLEGVNHQAPKAGHVWMPHLYYQHLSLVAHVWSSHAAYVDEDALFLSTPPSHHYGHWLNDFLPRLRGWGHAGRPREKIVISAELPAKHRDLLERFGVKQENLIECTLGSRYKFRNLTVVYAGSDGKPQPESLEFVRRALARVPENPVQPQRKFFLVRDIETRAPSNIAEFDSVLDDFGIEKVNPTKWSLATQERILGQTSLIIAAFGTELLCLYHLPRGADVIELAFDRDSHFVFAPKSAILGIRHHIIECELLKAGPITRRKIDFDIEVDCKALRQTLLEVCSRPSPDS